MQNLHNDTTVRTSNISDPNKNDTTEPPSTNIITSTIHDSLPKVPEILENICLPRVADRDDNIVTPTKRTIYNNLTRNPGNRRRATKKKIFSRKFFPKPNL